MLSKKKLLQKGYFPKELIPALNTNRLAEKMNFVMPVALGNDRKVSRPCVFSMPRLKNFRRLLSIPNPFSQIQVATQVIDGWNEIKRHLSKSNLSLTIPVVNQISDRYLSPKCDLSKLPTERVLQSTSSRYLLYVDISRYYSTIYTHSIPWALHTKPVAKRNRGDGLLGNRIDKFIRNGQHGQTFGIPTGPDTSLVISEIMGATIDYELKKRINKIKGFRYIDDFYLYFSNLSEAEFALSTLHEILRDYELELNTNKLSIVELPQTLDIKWVSELRLFPFDKLNNHGATYIIDYFSKAFELSKLYPNDYVLKYALSKIKEIEISQENWNVYEALILKTIMADASILPLATQLFLTYKRQGYPINKNRILETISEIVYYNAMRNNTFELTWSLWLCKTLDLKIGKKVAKHLTDVNNSIVALTTLGLIEDGLISMHIDMSMWKSLLKSEELYSENWLIAYEAKVRGWLTSTDDYVTNEAFFSVLKANDVFFYNKDLQIDELELKDLDEIDNFGDDEQLYKY